MYDILLLHLKGYKMAQIKQFHTGGDEKDYERQIRAHRGRKIITILLAMILIAVIIIIATINSNNKVYTSYSVKTSIEWSVSSDAQAIEYSGRIIIYSIDGAYCADNKGKSLWNITYQMQNPMVEVNGDYAAIGDYNGSTIYIMDENGKKGEVTTDLPIKKFSISESGYVTAVVANTSTTSIYLYSIDGEQVAYFKTTMDKSGYPFDISISDNGKLVAVDYLYVDTTGSTNQLVSRVAFYNFGSVGQNYEDHYVSGYDYEDSVVGMLRFLDDETSFAISDTELYIYKGKQIPSVDQTIELTQDVKSVFYDENYIGLVYQGNTGEEAYLLDVYNKDGEKTGTIPFTLEYTDIIFSHNCAVIYNSTEAALYTMKGKCRFETTFDENMILVLPTSSKTMYSFVSKNKIDNVELK